MGARPAEINGHPGLLTTDGDGRLLGVLALDIADGRVQTVHSIVNPRQAPPPGAGRRRERLPRRDRALTGGGLRGGLRG